MSEEHEKALTDANAESDQAKRAHDSNAYDSRH
jgi:hypothetical protein